MAFNNYVFDDVIYSEKDRKSMIYQSFIFKIGGIVST